MKVDNISSMHAVWYPYGVLLCGVRTVPGSIFQKSLSNVVSNVHVRTMVRTYGVLYPLTIQVDGGAVARFDIPSSEL